MDTSALRHHFRQYLSNRFPNNHHIGSTVSAAFFLERHVAMVGLDFQRIPDKIRSQNFVPKPTKQAVSEYLSKWNTLTKYKDQEEAVNLLL